MLAVSHAGQAGALATRRAVGPAAPRVTVAGRAIRLQRRLRVACSAEPLEDPSTTGINVPWLPQRRLVKRAVTAPGSGSAGIELAPHKPVGIMLASAYALGAASALAGVASPTWIPALTGAAIGGVFAAMDRWCKARLWRPPATPLTAVITGGTRGLGKAMAREFLASGDRVLITGTSEEGVRKALVELAAEAGLSPDDVQLPSSDQAGSSSSSRAAPRPAPPRLCGMVADVSNSADVARLAVAAAGVLGDVDVWLCNAGCSGSFAPFLAAEEGVYERVVGTNLLGALLSARQAAQLMMGQRLGGHIFLVDGAGSDGLATPGYAAYGATKAALPQLARSLQQELSATHVGVHVVSPGMMLTELLLDNASARNKAVFNILCEPAEVPAAFLAPRIRTVVGQGAANAYIRYLTPLSALYRFMTAPLRMGRFFDKDGEPVYLPEDERLRGAGAKATARSRAHARQRGSGLAVAYGLSIAASMMFMVLDKGGHHLS